MDEYKRSELETAQKVTLISWWVNEVFMEVYLAIACRTLWRLSPTPNEGRPNVVGQASGRPILRVSWGLPLVYFRG